MHANPSRGRDRRRRQGRYGPGKWGNEIASQGHFTVSPVSETNMAILARPQWRLARIGLRSAGLGSQIALYAIVWLALWSVLPALLLGWTSVLITSGSMHPTIRPGDVVVAQPWTEADLGAGTVVTFAPPGHPGLVTHRVVRVNSDGTYVTQGDANPNPDSTPLSPEHVVGVGRLRIPLIGLPLLWFQTGAWVPLGAWIGVTILALWLAGLDLRSDGPRQP